MKEQSHKEEMSAALRGDFKRLRERGVATTLSPGESLELDQPVEPAEPETGDGETVAVSPPEPSLVEQPDAAPPAAEPEPEPEPEPAPAPAAEPSPGWLGRLLGR